MDKKDINISEIVPNNISISRRDFLKLFAIGTGAVLFGSVLPNKDENITALNFMSNNLASLVDMSGSRDALNIEESLIKEADEIGNDNYLPYLDVIQSSVEKFYSNNPNKTVVWEKSTNYLSDVDAIKLLAIPIKEEEVFPGDEKYIGMIPLQILSDTFKNKEVIFKLYGIFYKRIPDEIQAVINVANTQMVAVPGTQLYSEHHPKIGNVFSDEDIFNYYEPIKDEIENKYKQKDNSKTFTMSTLLTYFLEKNDGNLKSSLGDMAGFLKYMIRSYWRGGTLETNPQIDWVRSHVIDQVNKNFSLNKIPSPDSLSGESRDNVLSVWGLIYHVPYLVSMLAYVSPNIIRVATMYEYTTHTHVAGAYKIKVDIDVIKKMNDMFRYFQKFN